MNINRTLSELAALTRLKWPALGNWDAALDAGTANYTARCDSAAYGQVSTASAARLASTAGNVRSRAGAGLSQLLGFRRQRAESHARYRRRSWTNSSQVERS